LPIFHERKCLQYAFAVRSPGRRSHQRDYRNALEWVAAGHRYLGDKGLSTRRVDPSKIVCVGRNYAAHAAEMGNEVPVEPLIFFKPPSSIVGPHAPIALTKYSKKVEHEGELGVVMAKKCSQLSDAADPFYYVLGYTCK
jgi:2-keto-4-pentenoate hydratase/2-oxohepta-3-ene-1,7-dioic acid hydratase in catechol pathway